MLNLPIDAIDENALAQLVANQVAERRDLEFKRDLPGRNDEQVKEFLADVTALANAQGGDLVFGIEDAGGTAAGLPGLDVPDTDAEILRLESSIRTGVDPKLIGVRTHWVPLSSGRGALVIRVPAGLATPHRVIFRNSGRFYNRTSRGKYEMDVHELRHAFTEAQTIPQRFRQLHAQAIEMARGVDMPFALSADPTAVASIIPLSLFREQREIAIEFGRAILPHGGGNYSYFDTIEGVLTHTPIDPETGTVRSIVLTHRVGRTDAAWTIGGIREFRAGQFSHHVYAPSFEQGLLDAAISSQTRLRDFGIEGPWIVLASVYGVKGFQMPTGDHYATKPAFRDRALLGELRIDHLDEGALLPILKRFWLLFGEHRPEGRQIAQR